MSVLIKKTAPTIVGIDPRGFVPVSEGTLLPASTQTERIRLLEVILQFWRGYTMTYLPSGQADMSVFVGRCWEAIRAEPVGMTPAITVEALLTRSGNATPLQTILFLAQRVQAARAERATLLERLRFLDRVECVFDTRAAS